MAKTCFLYFYEGCISVSPTIISLSELLANNEYTVIIFASKNENPYPKFKPKSDKAIVVYCSNGNNIPLINFLYKLFYRIKLGTLVPVMELIVFGFQVASYIVRKYQLVASQSSIDIGVDTNGSILALINHYIFKREFIYLSLEIHPFSYFEKFSKILKLFECLAYRQAKAIIIQDQERFDSLCKYNYFQPVTVFYLPNAPSSLDKSCEKISNDNYFRDKFNLREDKYSCLVVQAGMLNDCVFSKEIAYAFNCINSEYALIYHERERLDIHNPYIEELKKINSKNLFLSLDPLPIEEINRVFDSVTIGLAFYRNISNNFSQISKASGKLSYYLKSGKPVLVNNLKSLAELVNKYKIGVVIDNPSDPIEIEAAIKKILDNYNFYSENAKICFSTEFDFANKVKPLLSYISSWSRTE